MKETRERKPADPEAVKGIIRILKGGSTTFVNRNNTHLVNGYDYLPKRRRDEQNG